MFGLQQPTGGLIEVVCSLAYKLAVFWHQPTFIQVTQVNSCNSFVIDDSTINVILVIIISYLLT